MVVWTRTAARRRKGRDACGRRRRADARAWCDNTVGQHEIYFETFGIDGRSLEPPRRLTDNKTESLIPAIRPSGNGFALVWNEFTPGPGGGHDPTGRSEIAFALVR